MGRYDYKSLSHQDFEELTRDLLQAEWNVVLEAFKSGRDSGIDLRHSQLNGGKVIIQCKHYASSQFRNLLSHLRNKELTKVKRLQPARYVLVTSILLSPSNKDELVSLFQPFILTPGDIFGANDLDGLLSRHPAVERANFKLWLTNTIVLERLLHNAEYSQTEFEVERIRQKLRVFVQNKTFTRARELLEKHRVVIISGVPGIGKTTLAEMLLYAHLEDNFQPVVIQTDIAEAKRLFRQQNKQIFYYDDFLGQTFLGDQRSYLGSNHDAALLNFMEMVRTTPHSKFVLTTREHILRRALQLSEKFFNSTMMSNHCVLELADYSFGQRARILYNHIYFSTLPKEYKEVILEDDYFLEIIKHDHFNPRLIEWLASLTRLGSPVVSEYKRSISALLQSSQTLWSHAYETQISDAGRDLLLTLYSLGDWTDVVELEPAFEEIHRGNASRYNRARAAGDFRGALQELDGSFLSYSASRAGFINPSIREFTAGVICRTPQIALNLADDAIRFKQVTNIWDLALERKNEPLHAVIVANSSDFRSNIERLLFGEYIRWETTAAGTKGHSIDSDLETRLKKLIELSDAFKDKEFMNVCNRLYEHLISKWKQFVYIPSGFRLLASMKDYTWFLQNGGKFIFRNLLDELLCHLHRAEAADWVALLQFKGSALEWTETDEFHVNEAFSRFLEQGVRDELENCADADELNDLRYSLGELNRRFSLDFSGMITEVDAAIAKQNESEPEPVDGGFSMPVYNDYKDTVSEEDVREMFKTLDEE